MADFETPDAILVVGSNLRREVPLLAHRVRKAALRGAWVSFINLAQHDYLFPVAESVVTEDLVAELGRVVWAAAQICTQVADLSPAVSGLDVDIKAPEPVHDRQAGALRDAADAVILLGQIAMRHPRFAEIRLLAAELARLTGASMAYIPEGANAAGLSLAGVLPHRGVGGEPVERPGATVAEMIANPLRGLMLVGVEPEHDCADGETALAAMASAEFVLALSPFLGDSLERHADVILPMGTFVETSGTYVNAAGDWQRFQGIAEPFGESRPGWKILRVLGNLIGMPDCDYETSEDICDELRRRVGDARPEHGLPLDEAPESVTTESVAYADLDVPMYRIDALVRRAECLQETRDGRGAGVAAVANRKIA